jgi:hypothetical protein
MKVKIAIGKSYAKERLKIFYICNASFHYENLIRNRHRKTQLTGSPVKIKNPGRALREPGKQPPDHWS